MTDDGIPAQCDYCGTDGVHGQSIESRNGKWACVDTTACDERDAARNGDEDDDA